MIASAAWNPPVIVGLLVLVVVMVAVNLLVGFVLWWRHSSLADRVTKLEVHNSHSMTREEVRLVFDRLALLEGRTEATNAMVKSIQSHLMENP